MSNSTGWRLRRLLVLPGAGVTTGSALPAACIPLPLRSVSYLLRPPERPALPQGHALVAVPASATPPLRSGFADGPPGLQALNPQIKRRPQRVARPSQPV